MSAGPDAAPILPHDVEAERSVLGSILLENRMLPLAGQIIRAGDFYRDGHRRLFRVMSDLAERAAAIDLITLKGELARLGILEDVGGSGYISSLVDGVPRSQNIEHYARIVASTAWRRRIAASAEATLRAACNGADDREVLEQLEDLHLETERGPRRPGLTGADVFSASVQPRHPKFAVDHLLRLAGLHLVWAQPSGGKTWTLLRWMMEMLLAEGPITLTGNADLRVRSRYRKVLWISTEEDTPGIRAKADMVCQGLGVKRPDGAFVHFWASAPGRRITLDDLPAILQDQGPVDAIVLDSLTGLRPKTVGGQRVQWDRDNDAANDQCLALRGLASTHETAIIIVHHTGRETEKGYRGPTDYWASVDVMLGLVPDRAAGKTKVYPQKNRDGIVLDSFYLVPRWGPDGFQLDYDGQAKPLTPATEKVLLFVRARGSASQVEIVKETGLSRATVIRSIQLLVADGLLRDTGNRINGSTIYALEFPEPPEAE